MRANTPIKDTGCLLGTAGELKVELVICSKPQTDPLSEALEEN